MAVVCIPPLLRQFTKGLDKVVVDGNTLEKVVDQLDESYPGLKSRLIVDGQLKPSITASIDGAFIRKGLYERVNADSEVTFIPNISGG
jgi:molybdopterin synthase sulfur carrier subunit